MGCQMVVLLHNVGNSMTNHLKKKSNCSPWPLLFCSNLAYTLTYTHCYIPGNFRFQGHMGHGIWVTWFLRSSRICQWIFLSLQVSRMHDPLHPTKIRKKTHQAIFWPRDLVTFSWPRDLLVPPTLKFWFFHGRCLLYALSGGALFAWYIWPVDPGVEN